MEYRKAEISDAAVLAALRKKQLIDEGGQPNDEIDDELEKYFSDGLSDDSLVVWVADDGGRIIGTAGACYFRYPPTFTNVQGKVAYVTNVYIEDAYRKRGIATNLMNEVMEDIKERGCKVIRLHASDQGRRLYEKLGFVDAEGFMIMRLS